MRNKKFYIDEFTSRLKPWSIYSQDRTWYKPRFQYRLSFRFGDSRASVYSTDWRNMLTNLQDNGYVFRHRSESYNVLFTSEHAILDSVLDTSLWLDHLKEFAYADDHYLSEFSQHAGMDAVTDIKFVKRAPEHCYQVTLGNFEWRKDDALRRSVAEYLAANRSEYVFKGFEQDIIDGVITGKKQSPYGQPIQVFHGFRFYAKNPDDIIMIHMMAPGHVTNIVKLMEKKVETITC